jgi:hypothetical protein
LTQLVRVAENILTDITTITTNASAADDDVVVKYKRRRVFDADDPRQVFGAHAILPAMEEILKAAE